jgi:glucosyl-3-phosphoglycerate synthase
MEYVQERVATLHDVTDPVPDAPTERACVVVPMTGRDCRSPAAERTLETLAAVEPARVIVALRAGPARAVAAESWLGSFSLPVETLWCGGPRLDALLADRGLDAGGADTAGKAVRADGSSAVANEGRKATRDGGRPSRNGPPGGKGRDVWLALGLAADHEFVVVHDADARTYSRAHVPRLLAPLADGFGSTRRGSTGGESAADESGSIDDAGGASEGYAFVKGYYARVEDGRLYGRLYRLLYAPLVCALRARHDAPVLRYLDAFRYALAGEFALTGELARRLRVQRGWGLEVGTLGEAFREVGFGGTAQVDLGVHEHAHRAVDGPAGLADMSGAVGRALLRAVEDGGVEPEYGTLPDRYRAAAAELIEAYAADAAFNRLEYDAAAEREQVDEYASAVVPPGPDRRLPAWVDAPLDPGEVRAAARADLAAAER